MFASVLVILLVASSLRADEPVPNANQLNGRWIVTKLVVDGAEIHVSKSVESFVFDFDDDLWLYSFVVNGNRTMVSFKVKLTKDDNGISVDAMLRNGVYENGVCKGICRFDGDIARLCLADKPSTARPDCFECPADSGLQLFELRRVKSSDPFQ